MNQSSFSVLELHSAAQAIQIISSFGEPSHWVHGPVPPPTLVLALHTPLQPPSPRCCFCLLRHPSFCADASGWAPPSSSSCLLFFSSLASAPSALPASTPRALPLFRLFPSVSIACSPRLLASCMQTLLMAVQRSRAEARSSQPVRSMNSVRPAKHRPRHASMPSAET